MFSRNFYKNQKEKINLLFLFYLPISIFDNLFEEGDSFIRDNPFLPIGNPPLFLQIPLPRSIFQRKIKGLRAS
ncbi:MAG: hypothetical protein ABGW77_06625 [Campylobacterales bacterium]